MDGATKTKDGGSFFYVRVQFKRSQNANVNVTVA